MEKEKDNLRVDTDELWEKNKDAWFENLDPEIKDVILKAETKKKVENLTPSQKYNALHQALKNGDVPESDKIIIEKAIKELRPLVLREHNIGTIVDRYPYFKIIEKIFIILLVLAGIFWFFIRPALVRQNCSTWTSQSDYEWCLRNSGIEP
jgi:hypothetical protein